MRSQLNLGEEKVYDLLLKIFIKEPDRAIEVSVIGKELGKRAPGTGCRYRNWALPHCETLVKKKLIEQSCKMVGSETFRIGKKAAGAYAVELAKGNEDISQKDMYATKIGKNLDHIKAMRRKNISEKEIAKKLGIGLTTLVEYKNTFPQLGYILDEGLDEAVSAVENSLFKKAIGYELTEIKTEDVFDKNGLPTGKTKVTTTAKHVPADLGAIAMILLNRKPEDWKDKRHINVEGKLGLEAILSDIAKSEERAQSKRIRDKLDPKDEVKIQQQA